MSERTPLPDSTPHDRRVAMETAGVTSLKYRTALRIAMNIAVDDAELADQVGEWSAETLYTYLEEGWKFRWVEKRQLWEQD